jgi:hypothetical protein
MARFVLHLPVNNSNSGYFATTQPNFLIDQKRLFYEPARDLFVKPRLSVGPEKKSRRKSL